MWAGIREQIDRAILAVATFLIVFAAALLLTVGWLRRRAGGDGLTGRSARSIAAGRVRISTTSDAGSMGRLRPTLAGFRVIATTFDAGGSAMLQEYFPILIVVAVFGISSPQAAWSRFPSPASSPGAKETA